MVLKENRVVNFNDKNEDVFSDRENGCYLRKKQSFLFDKKKKSLKNVKSESLLIFERSKYSDFSDFSENSNSDENEF